MGAVYKADQPSMKRFVAIKILHTRYLSRPDLISRFRREARAMSRLTHPNTARVYLHGQLDDGAAYMVMEYLEGKNLARLVQRDGPLDPVRAIQVMIKVCGALDEAHREGMVHRDLKPENIFLSVDPEKGDIPKVLDFGLAKVTEQELNPGSIFLTREGAIFGTPEFMSPEQAQGRVLDARSDIYSLSMILYEMLTGELPFYAGQATEYMRKHIHEAPIPLSKRAPERSYPPGLEMVLLRAMEKDPDERFQTAKEFSQALHACIDPRGQSSPPRKNSGRVHPREQSHLQGRCQPRRSPVS
ncbi:MAG: serine/threonine protein kinase [Myxococcales bacterium]|nr:MAG: serine/threonine protein kinase [Myxococcales bacterium]